MTAAQTWAEKAEKEDARIRTKILALMAGDADGLIQLMCDLDAVVKVYQDLSRDVMALALAALPPMKRDEGYVVDGLGTFTPKPGSSSRKYDNARLVSKLHETMPLAVNPDTGEDITPQIVDLMVALTGAGTASYNSWRITQLQGLGIDPRAYVTEETMGRPTLQKSLNKNAKEAK